jgi:hypothetical protein
MWNNMIHHIYCEIYPYFEYASPWAVILVLDAAFLLFVYIPLRMVSHIMGWE